MRSWVLMCAWLVMCSCASGQFRHRQRFGGGQRGGQSEGGGTGTNIRLGLVATDINVPAVPGGQNSNFVNSRPLDKCICLPVNQVCPSSITNPIFDVRIINRPTSGNCGDQKMCCPEGHRPSPGQPPRPQPVPVQPFPGTPTQPFPINPGREPPVVPQPTQLGVCGVQNPQPYRVAQFAEADFGEYPWTAVVLGPGDLYLGGGVIVNNRWVLTAAHKIHKASNIKVRLGELDVSKTRDHPSLPHIEVAVNNVVIHPDFDSVRLLNDVALLRLSNPINFNNYPHIGPACLPEQGQIFAGNQRCWVTGWGKDSFSNQGAFQTILKEVDVPMVDEFVCEERLKLTRLTSTFRLNTNSFVCAGGEEGKDACTGDGGAPLVCQGRQGWTVVGLVAWGIGCAEGGIPGVYVKVSSYINFIQPIISGRQG